MTQILFVEKTTPSLVWGNWRKLNLTPCSKFSQLHFLDKTWKIHIKVLSLQPSNLLCPVVDVFQTICLPTAPAFFCSKSKSVLVR